MQKLLIVVAATNFMACDAIVDAAPLGTTIGGRTVGTSVTTRSFEPENYRDEQRHATWSHPVHRRTRRR
jgi:hypothetical protein